MQDFDIVIKSNAENSFRVASIMGKFDLQSPNIEERFTGNIDLSNDWKVGLIVGKSGTGKTTIAKQLFKDAYITNYKYTDKSILDDMPQDKSVDDITNAFNSVGFSSPPSWLKSYGVLSNGQKMRVDLARSILEENKLIVFDEFTSVVDREVAKVGSYAIQKSIRKSNKQFIAVTCHSDVEDWLLPDWIFNTDTMTFTNNEGQKKNKPDIKFEIYSTINKDIWKMFSKHHYLSHTHNNAASVYIGLVNDQIVGFLSVLHFPHPKAKNIKKVHRLVILPDYQGLGIGIRLLNEVGKIYVKQNQRYNIVTTSPSLINALKKSKDWICTRYGRVKEVGKTSTQMRGHTSKNRITVSFEYNPIVI